MSINLLKNNIVNFVIATELEQFKQDFDLNPIPQSQDISSLSIEWLCFYCKENISLQNRDAIINFVNEVKSKNYNSVGWCRIPALLAAAYILEEKENFINDLFVNLDCHQSNNRGFICKALSIICEILPFENQYFQNAVESNLIERHNFDDVSVTLLLNSNGDFESKVQWLKGISENEFLKSSKFLPGLLMGETYEDDFFKKTLDEIKSHILFRILKHSYSFNNQLNLFDENKRIQPKTLNTFRDNHPLYKESFNFEIN